MRKNLPLLLILWLFVLVSPAFSQEMLTASQYFDTVYQKYQDTQDLTADVTLMSGSSTSSGSLFFKAPSAFKLEFNDGRVFVKQGNKLTVYSPGLNTTFVQSLKSQTTNPNPLSILKSEYAVSYVSGPALEPLDEGSSESVHKLLFRRRVLRGATISQMEIAFTREGFLRRVIAVTNTGRTMVLDFNRTQMNTGLFESQFNYEPPHAADIVNNFLYDEV